MSLHILACLLLVFMPAYEGCMVHALQHVAEAMHTLPVAVVSTAQQFMEAVVQGKRHIEIIDHLDLRAMGAVEVGASGRLSKTAGLDVFASTISIQVSPLVAQKCHDTA